MNIKPIQSDDDHAAAMVRINELWDAPMDTPEGDELDVLVALVEAYESKRWPIEAPDPVEAIKFRMDQMGLTADDMVKFLGHRSRVSEILNKQRKLTLRMIRNLFSGLQIPLRSLVEDYALESKQPHPSGAQVRR